MSKPNRGTTERGFAIYDRFFDQKGTEIHVQKSSLANEPCVWIFSTALGAHLTIEQAKRVRDALDTFISENA